MNAVAQVRHEAKTEIVKMRDKIQEVRTCVVFLEIWSKEKNTTNSVREEMRVHFQLCSRGGGGRIS